MTFFLTGIGLKILLGGLLLGLLTAIFIGYRNGQRDIGGLIERTEIKARNLKIRAIQDAVPIDDPDNIDAIIASM